MSVDLVKNKFDNKEFNADFVKYMNQKTEEENKRNIAKLKELSTEVYKKKITEMSMNEMLIDWRKSIIGISDDLLNKRFQLDTLFRDNRLFFTGITVVIVVVMFYFFYWLFFGGTSKENIVKNEHVFNISFSMPNPTVEQKGFISSFFSRLFKRKTPVTDGTTI